jgi:alpha-L-arabinofuranosidase
MYVQALKAFVPPIRAAYPKARIIALGEDSAQGLVEGGESVWRERVLQEAGALADVISIGRYKGQWHPDAESRMANAAESVGKISHDLRELIAACRAHGSRARVALQEWNYWLRASHWDGRDFAEPWDAQHSMFVAGMLNEFARLAPDFELGCFYHLLNNMSIFDSHGPVVLETDAAEVFRLYRAALPGLLRALDVQAPPLGEALALDALCLENGDGLWLFAANRSPSAAVQVELTGFPRQSDEGILFRAAAPQDAFTKQTCSPDGNMLPLPPLSLARIRFAVNP